MQDVIKKDQMRYPEHKGMPVFQFLLRKAQTTHGIVQKIYKLLYYVFRTWSHIEIYTSCKIGAGLYIGHGSGITINPAAIIGENCNLHKGVTIGQENRGPRKGAPVIGDCVWIGVNATIVGNVKIGNDVLIAPNSFVNCDIPSHCVVLGNPCIIRQRENATENYINRKI